MGVRGPQGPRGPTGPRVSYTTLINSSQDVEIITFDLISHKGKSIMQT